MGTKDLKLDISSRCPQCGHAKEERMPTDSCTFFYNRESCGARVKPKPGDCCVFCSYGSERCPPSQVEVG